MNIQFVYTISYSLVYTKAVHQSLILKVPWRTLLTLGLMQATLATLASVMATVSIPATVVLRLHYTFLHLIAFQQKWDSLQQPQLLVSSTTAYKSQRGNFQHCCQLPAWQLSGGYVPRVAEANSRAGRLSTETALGNKWTEKCQQDSVGFPARPTPGQRALIALPTH